MARGARLFDPSYAKSLSKAEGEALIDLLDSVPMLDDEHYSSGLKKELGSYLAECLASKEIEKNPPKDFLQFHHERKGARPIFAETVRILVLIQPSSAAAERAFSILNSTFTPFQSPALKDLVQTAIMLRYNKRDI